jgi:ribose transport system permease protein
VFIAVILACVFLSFATDSFATTKNLYNITRNITFVAIIALGMTLVIITGGIDLSVGSVLCLCSMVLAVVMHAGYGIGVGIAASLGTALIVGTFNGVLIAYLGFPPFVVTLGMLSIARSLAMVASNNTVVFQFGPDHDLLLDIGGGDWLFGIANPVLYMIVLALLTGFVLRWTSSAAMSSPLAAMSTQPRPAFRCARSRSRFTSSRPCRRGSRASSRPAGLARSRPTSAPAWNCR